MDNDNKKYRTIIRLVEYYGPPEWLEATLAASRIPIQGVKQFQNGVYIRGGVVVWQPDAIVEAQVEDSDINRVNGSNNQMSKEMSRAVEAAKTVVFKRPGEN